MNIAICGPVDTAYLRQRLGLRLTGAPPGVRAMSVSIEIVEICRRGIPLTIVTADTSIIESVCVTDGLLRIFYIPMRSRARHRALDFFRQEIRSMAQMLIKARPDIVHAHWSYEFALAGLRSKLPLVITCRDSPLDVFFQYRDRYRLLRLLMAISVFCRRSVFTAVSPYLNSRISWMLRGQCVVIPNGVDLNEFSRGPRTAACTENPILVTVGNSSSLKNVKAAVAAFGLIRRELPGTELHLFGPGLSTAEIPSADGIYPHGARPYAEVTAFLCEQADLMIHPSLEESFSMAALEGLAAGLPVIGGIRSGGVPYVLGYSASDCLVDIRDPVAIATAAVRILKDENLYICLASQAKENVHQRFTAEIMVDSYLHLMEEVLK